MNKQGFVHPGSTLPISKLPHNLPPAVNIPIPTKIGSKMGGEFTETLKMGSQNGFDHHSHLQIHRPLGSTGHPPASARGTGWSGSGEGADEGARPAAPQGSVGGGPARSGGVGWGGGGAGGGGVVGGGVWGDGGGGSGVGVGCESRVGKSPPCLPVLGGSRLVWFDLVLSGF